jgi:hypothetical protein
VLRTEKLEKPSSDVSDLMTIVLLMKKILGDECFHLPSHGFAVYLGEQEAEGGHHLVPHES